MYDLFPQEAEKYYADDLEVIQSGTPRLGIIEKLRGRADTELWVQTDKVPVCDRAGNVIGIVVMVQDITERKRIDESLKLFRTLIDGSPDAIEVIDPDTGRFLDINTAGCARLGYSREELLSLTLADIDIERDYRLEWPNIVEEIKRTGVGHVYGLHRRKDGSTFPVEVNARYINLNRGYMVAVVRDITERKRLETRFRRLVDSNAQGVFFWNKMGEITRANDAFLQLVRYTQEDLKAGLLNWANMTPPEFAHLDQRAMEELAATGVCASYEKEFILKDGARVPVLLGAAIFEDKPDEGVCFVLDLTERKKLEQQFLRAQRMESIGTLAGGIAHDLNNVLAPITMSIDLLKMKFTDKSSQELLATLGSSAQRGAEMVRQVLSFARGVEGRKMEVQVKHLLKDIEKIANDTFPKNIHVRSIIPNELWTILGDPTQLHQVLLNLCVNARDAMPNGGTLTISAENVHLDEHYAGLNPDAHPGSYVFLQITDTGTGMPPGIIEKIFDPFFTTKEIGKGTGLGLSTSLAIVKSHGGFIRVYSEPGKGTTFKAYFPGQTEFSAEAEAEIAAELPRGNGEFILVIDDEANVRQITRQTLEAFGYRVVVASDGAEAVAIVARQDTEIAVVLTDMMMPVMDGPATIQVLLRLKPDLPIIAASGLSADGRVTQAAGLGVKHFLSKPYSADALLQVLRQILSAK